MQQHSTFFVFFVVLFPTLISCSLRSLAVDYCRGQSTSYTLYFIEASIDPAMASCEHSILANAGSCQFSEQTAYESKQGHICMNWASSSCVDLLGSQMTITGYYQCTESNAVSDPIVVIFNANTQTMTEYEAIGKYMRVTYWIGVNCNDVPIKTPRTCYATKTICGMFSLMVSILLILLL